MTQGRYEIRPATAEDATLVSRWRAHPHVHRWWGDEAEPLADVIAEAGLRVWIVMLDGAPFAFIQDYDVHAWTPHHFDYLPKGACGMDVFIGEPAMIGAGHGPALVRQHVDRLFASGVPALGIDPHPDNLAARRAFQKAGFTLRGGPLETRWGRAVLMDRFAGR